MKKLISIVLGLVLVIAFSGVTLSDHAQAKNNTVKFKVFVHYPNPQGKAVIVSNCSQTINDRVTDYGVTGWHMPNSGMTYKINYTSKPSNLNNNQVLNSISSSFNMWSNADSKQIFSEGGSTTVKTAKFDGTNAILWKAINGSALAITYSWYYTSTGQLAESDTIFNRNYKWTSTAYNGSNDCGGINGTYDLQNIATHEFGHWIGLDDLYAQVDKDLTMYGYGETKELKKGSLGAGDSIGVNAILP